MGICPRPQKDRDTTLSFSYMIPKRPTIPWQVQRSVAHSDFSHDYNFYFSKCQISKFKKNCVGAPAFLVPPALAGSLPEKVRGVNKYDRTLWNPQTHAATVITYYTRDFLYLSMNTYKPCFNLVCGNNLVPGINSLFHRCMLIG